MTGSLHHSSTKNSPYALTRCCDCGSVCRSEWFALRYRNHFRTRARFLIMRTGSSAAQRWHGNESHSRLNEAQERSTSAAIACRRSMAVGAWPQSSPWSLRNFDVSTNTENALQSKRDSNGCTMPSESMTGTVNWLIASNNRADEHANAAG